MARHEAGDSAGLLASRHATKFGITHKQYSTGSLHEMHRASLLHTPCPAESQHTLPLSPTGSSRWGSLGWKRTPGLPSSTSHVYFTSTLTLGFPSEGRKKDNAGKQAEGRVGKAPRAGHAVSTCKHFSTEHPSRPGKNSLRKEEKEPDNPHSSDLSLVLLVRYLEWTMVLLEPGQNNVWFI